MNSKSILKEVREAIKNEKYADAIKKCQDIVRNEPENYMAYLLLGAAYQNSDKSEAAKHLRKAVQYSPSAPTVALQGLSNCAPIEELPAVYEQLMELVPEKRTDYYEKLFLLRGNAAILKESFTIFKSELKRRCNEEQKLVLRYLGRIWLMNDFEVITDEEQLFKTALKEIIADEQIDMHLNACKRYLKLLFKERNYAECIKRAGIMIVQYPNDIYAYEWICKIYCENYKIAQNSDWFKELNEPIDYYVNALLGLNESSSLALLIQAIHCYEQGKFVAARELLYRVQNIQPKYEVAIEWLAYTEMSVGAFGLALPLWQQLEKHSDKYAICLSYETEAEQLGEATRLLEINVTKTDDILDALARCYHSLKQNDKLNALPLTDVMKAEYTMSPIAAIEFLQNSSELELFSVQLLLGKLYMTLFQYTDALTCMLKATRLKPHRSECFFLLGKIYYAINDIIRARKCFEKCVNLNPLCEEAVNNLSAIYQQLNEEDLNVALLVNTLKYMKVEKSKRIQYKLGLHYLHVKNCDEAIQCFRAAIKQDVSCVIFWESLGDAYCERGSYNSAIRVFQKTLEFNEHNLYAKLQIALIKTTIRMYTEAIEDFNDLLQKHPDFLPVLKGVAEAHVSLAHNMKLEHRYGRCKTHLQLAMNYLQNVFLTIDNCDMVWLWRLTACVFLQVAQLPGSLANLDVAGKLARRETTTVFLTRKDLVNLAVRFCTCALRLKQNTFLWYELSLCCYYSACYESAEPKQLLDLATKACKMAIKAESTRWHNWNLLGVINMHKVNRNLPLAQHCFIQALTIERKSYTTWTNLGVLYLKLNEIKLANQAFQRAQQSSPVYPNAWIGQAMIAEAINEEEEALDLFRHCQQFEFHPESAIGFAHWVSVILSDANKCKQSHYKHAIESMYADIVALDAINLYATNEEDEASLAALSFQGFLNVRHKLYRSALTAYLQAVKKAAIGAERDKMLTNLGYLYLSIKQPDSAINVFNSVTQASFTAIIGLALAFFRSGQHQEAYSVYNTVLKTVAGVEDDKAACILVAMASMVYESQGEADTKTILYQCILLKDSPIQALYSACALGILHQDNQLAETILNELKKYENCEEHCAHIAYLMSQYYLVNNEIRKGLNYLTSRVHIFPQCAELRKVLAKFMLNNLNQSSRYHLATSQIALSAIELIHRHKAKKSNCIEEAETLLIASRALCPIDKTRALKIIQRAIHLHPQNQNAWKTLLQVH